MAAAELADGTEEIFSSTAGASFGALDDFSSIGVGGS
jgi:hypothetical protein